MVLSETSLSSRALGNSKAFIINSTCRRIPRISHVVIIRLDHYSFTGIRRLLQVSGHSTCRICILKLRRSPSNAITLEHITSRYPNSGVLITFFQFLIVSLYGLPKQFTFDDPRGSHHAENGPVSVPNVRRRRWLPRLKKRRVPLLPYLIQVALFFVLSTLNNAAFAYDIPMTVHIVFRSGGMIVNMILGWILMRKRLVIATVF